MDGIDGLAGLEALCASGFGGLLLTWSGLGGLAEAALALTGASAGFLIWNWPPAKIFMGDAGSGFLGFVFGVLAISSAQQRPWLLWPWVILLSVFIVDSTLTLMRRLFTGARWYEAHCSHAYQHAARRSGSHSKVTLRIAAVNVGWLFPFALGAYVWPALAAPLAVVALAPLVYLAFRYGAGQDTSVINVTRSRAKDRKFGSLAQIISSELLASRAWHLIARTRLVPRLAQFTIFILAALGAFLLRFEFSVPQQYLQHLFFAVATWAVVKSLVFKLQGLDRGWWRFVSTPDLLRVCAANFNGSIVGGLVILFFGPPAFPRSLYILDFLLCFVATAAIRLAARLLAEATTHRGAVGSQRTLIYGAGVPGLMLLRESRSDPTLDYTVVGFIDDDLTKSGLRIQGVPILGPGDRLVSLVAKHDIHLVLIALPSATGVEMTRVLRFCEEAGVRFRTLPSMVEIVEGPALANQIRDVAVEDLLGRTPARLDQDRISATLTGNTVLVTGAAGSIGSELCRQIARFNPRAIVGFEIAETALYHLEREPFYAEIGSIQNKQRLTEILEQYRPSILYHAAAYKHVPMMEAHIFEAVENNVFGTWNVALAAADHGVDQFVMISSDKAVRPTNIMGATKRVAELVILGLQNGGTNFVSVRFGNVLGSNGSVIPIFKQQIAAGGPLTVTHPQMRRYFMTISEASQLVLQASTMGHGGEIFVLDMGAPVKIVDLARNLILLSGFRPDEDIKIEFTGVRPGEKLYEELNSLEEDTLPTSCEKIKIFTGNGLPSAGMERYLEVLRDVCRRRDVPGLVLTLKDLIHDYNPSAELLRRVVHPHETAVAAASGAKAVAAR
jgi:FlaA1/EpsC-like NDP-sugar epimerase